MVTRVWEGDGALVLNGERLSVLENEKSSGGR